MSNPNPNSDKTGSINYQLSLLYELQQIEVKIKSLQEKKNQLPPKLKELDAKFEEQKALLEKKKKEADEAKVAQKLKTNLLQTQQEQLKKYQLQRFEVKTNKEYQALEDEIAKLSDKNSALEDQILETMFLIDKLAEEYKLQEKMYEQREKEYKIKRSELLSGLEAIERESNEWNQKRIEKYKAVEKSLIQKYESWKRRTGTFLLSAITEENACSGCYITVPPQVINEIRKDIAIMTCTSCGRILYYIERG
jgi:predicted  nucleic acid-binding Zn-ribbon protein